MSLLVRRKTTEGASTDRAVDGVIGVGRATDNTVELPGLRVALHHLRLTPLGPTTLRAECVSSADITVNERPGQRVAEVGPGDEIGVGPHRLRLLRQGQGPLVLEVLEQDARAPGRDEASPTTLAEAGWTLRRWSWGLAGLVLVLALLAPLLLRGSALPAALATWLPTDHAWSSGGISNAHANFGAECGTCHTRLFQQVQDTACLSCHAGVAHHTDQARVLVDSGLDRRRCASCHFEHNGAQGLVTRHDGLCVDCHGHPQQHPALAKAPSPAIFDFGRSHPAFKVEVAAPVRAGGPATQRAVLDAKTRDRHGLIFSHHLHLDPKGIRGPEQREVLTCATCHVPERGGLGFAPTDFKAQCQRCHQLDVEFAGRPMRLPHGDNGLLRAQLEAVLAGAPEAAQIPPPPPPEDLRRRPGDTASRGEGLEQIGAIDELFEPRVCAKCHEIDRGPPLAVKAPMLRQSWMVKAHFTHEPHRWVRCDTCHAAEASSDSDELLLPPIETCQTCHGSEQAEGAVQTGCVDCHQFHQGQTLKMGPPPGPRLHVTPTRR